MPVQRLYSLPYCTLILEGLSQGATTDLMGRPSLDVLMRFECQLLGQQKRLIGGKELLESLQNATTETIQSWLSGVKSGRGHIPSSGGVILSPIDEDNFTLKVPKSLLLAEPTFNQGAVSTTDSPEKGEPKLTSDLELKLSLVQVFDLVEAFDQLLADSQTLPSLTWQPTSLPRREAVAMGGSSLQQQAAAPALGISGLAAAAALLLLMPIPQVRRLATPPTPAPQQTTAPSPIPLTPPVIPSTPPPTPVLTPTPTGVPTPSVVPSEPVPAVPTQTPTPAPAAAPASPSGTNPPVLPTIPPTAPSATPSVAPPSTPPISPSSPSDVPPTTAPVPTETPPVTPAETPPVTPAPP